MIKQLRLDGFLSFAPGSEPFELRPLNVLIGPNGSGKSNLIEALGLLATTPHDLASAVRGGGGAGEWLWKGSPTARSMEIEAVLDRESMPTGREIRYRLSLASVQRRLEILDEAIEEVDSIPGKDDVYFYYRFRQGHPVLNLRTVADDSVERRLRREDLLPDQSVLAQVKDPEQYPEVTRGRKKVLWHSDTHRVDIRSPYTSARSAAGRPAGGPSAARQQQPRFSSEPDRTFRRHEGQCSVEGFLSLVSIASPYAYGAVRYSSTYSSQVSRLRSPRPAFPTARCVSSRCLLRSTHPRHHRSSASRSLNSGSTPMPWRY